MSFVCQSKSNNIFKLFSLNMSINTNYVIAGLAFLTIISTKNYETIGSKVGFFHVTEEGWVRRSKSPNKQQLHSQPSDLR